MKKLKILCDYTVLDDFKYKICDIDNNVIYTAFVDIAAPFRMFFKIKKLYLSKISIKENNKIVCSILKHFNFFTKKLYTIKYNNKKYFVYNSFEPNIPNLYIKLGNKELKLSGFLIENKINIVIDNDILATFSWHHKNLEKEYDLSYDNDDYKILYISLLLIFDNIYHDY